MKWNNYLVLGSPNVEGKITYALTTVQGVLTGIIVLVGIVVCLWILITNMHKLNNAHEKDEVFRANGRVLGAVAFGAAVVWIVPWVYNLFI